MTVVVPIAQVCCSSFILDPSIRCQTLTPLSFVLFVPSPIEQLPYFWRVWMSKLTPFTYLIEGLTANALGGATIACTPDQFNYLVPPSGQDCLSYLSNFTTNGFGYAQVVDGQCGYCPVSSLTRRR